MYFVSFQRWKGSLGCMKKLLLTLLALGIAGNAYAANLLMDIKSKDYNASTALTEINGAITTLAENRLKTIHYGQSQSLRMLC